VNRRAEGMRAVNGLGRARLADNYATVALEKAYARKAQAEAQLTELGMDPLVKLRELHQRCDVLLTKIDQLDSFDAEPVKRRASR
jgi:hypothetical protein